MNDDYTNAEIADRFYKRLTSPFALAEHYVIASLNRPKDETIVIRVKKLKERLQTVYWLGITENGKIHYARVSEMLECTLRWFYINLFSFLSPHEIERTKNKLVLFPEKAAEVDWEELLYRFLALEKLIDTAFRFIPAYFIEYYRTVEFYNVSRLLALDEKPFDNTIMTQVIKRFSEHLGLYFKLDAEHYWGQFDTPPLQDNLHKLKLKTADLRFTINQVHQHGLPSTFPQFYHETFTKEAVTKSMRELLESHELKEQQLVARLDYREYQSQQEVSIVSVTPRQLTILAEHREALFEALLPYVVSGLEGLKLLLTDRVAEEQVVVKGRPGNSLAYVFRQALEANYIANTKTDIAGWLVHWFELEDSKGRRKLVYETIYDALSKEKKPAKNKRIPYNP